MAADENEVEQGIEATGYAVGAQHGRWVFFLANGMEMAFGGRACSILDQDTL